MGGSLGLNPIKDYNELLDVIRHIHFAGYQLCKQSLGEYLPNAKNMGVFCHADDEWERLTELRKSITEPSDNPNQKYFHLLNPIVITTKGDVSEIAYEYLYIRKPDPSESHLGDIDFYLELKDYQKLKVSLINGKVIPGARIYDRKDLDMIELYDPAINVLAYVSTKEMTEKVRIKQSEMTKL